MECHSLDCSPVEIKSSPLKTESDCSSYQIRNGGGESVRAGPTDLLSMKILHGREEKKKKPERHPENVPDRFISDLCCM